jgi:hypothetical protein
LAAILAACGSSSGDDASPDSVTTGFHSMDDVVKSVLGHTRGEISLAQSKAQAADLRSCMSDGGFALAKADELLVDVPDVDESAAGDAIGFLIRQLDTLEPSPDATPAPNEDPAYVERYNNCLNTALSSVPDPLADLSAWFAEEAQTIQDRIESDSRVVEALDARTVCVAALGYDSSDPTELINRVTISGNEIAEQAHRGEISVADARDRLAELKIRQDELRSQLRPCLDAYMDVEQVVSDEEYGQFVEKNGAAIREHLTGVDLGLVSAYL